MIGSDVVLVCMAPGCQEVVDHPPYLCPSHHRQYLAWCWQEQQKGETGLTPGDWVVRGLIPSRYGGRV